MKDCDVPKPAVERICLYLRQLEVFADDGLEKISSRELGKSLHVAAAQVRKDLGYFGQFGRPGMGYCIGPLVSELRRILGTDKTWNVAVVGVGDLGRALLGHKGFRRKGFEVVAAFDVSWRKVGKLIGGVQVYHMSRVKEIVQKHHVKLAVLTVPVDVAQEVADIFQKAGVKGILNFAPTTLKASEDVAIDQVDIAAHLEQLIFRVGTATRG